MPERKSFVAVSRAKLKERAASIGPIVANLAFELGKGTVGCYTEVTGIEVGTFVTLVEVLGGSGSVHSQAL